GVNEKSVGRSSRAWRGPRVPVARWVRNQLDLQLEHEFVEVNGFGEVSIEASVQRPLLVLQRSPSCRGDQSGLRARPTAPCNFVAVDARQADVHTDDIVSGSVNHGECVFACMSDVNLEAA